MSAPTIDLVAADLRDVTDALGSGRITTEDLVQQYLDRIDKDNVNGLGLRAVIETAPRDLLFKQARCLDDERKRGETRGTLHGVPVLIKDSISTHPSMGMQTTAGTIVLEGSIVKRSASLVDQMIKAGIIILGKANMTIMGNYYGDHPSGWSPRGGQTISYIKPDMNPSGSSSGSAVGVSAGFCAASVGGETNGSILSPAQRAGLYGMKPTVGLVPCDEVVGISSRIDCLGPMGKSTWDVAAMLEVMASPSRDFLKYTQAPYNDLSTTPIRLGIQRDSFDPTARPDKEVDASLIPEAGTLWKDALERLSRIIKADPANIPEIDVLFQKGGSAAAPWLTGPNARLMESEMWDAVVEHLERIDNGKVHNLEEFVNWNNDHPDLAFHNQKGTGQQQRLVEALERKGVKDESYQAALDTHARIAGNIEGLFADQAIDVLAFPALLNCRPTTVATCGGFPIATVPIGQLNNGWPCGMHLFALKGQEEKLIAAMAACENALRFKPRRV